MSEEPQFCYVGRKPECGCLVAAVVDGNGPPGISRTEVAEMVKGFIESGLQIEHVTMEFARSHLKRCPHAQK